MEITLTRKTKKEAYTLGELVVKGVAFPTIEDVERDTNNNGKIDNGEVKIWGETAIPCGRYRVVLNEVSPKFSKYDFYMQTCKGRLPRLQDVPDFQGVLIHCGRTEKNSSGCILLNDYNASLDKSKDYFKRFYELIRDEEDIWLTIV